MTEEQRQIRNTTIYLENIEKRLSSIDFALRCILLVIGMILGGVLFILFN